MSFDAAELGREHRGRRGVEQSLSVELTQRDELVVPVESYGGAEGPRRSLLHNVVQAIAVVFDFCEAIVDVIEETGGIEPAQVFAKQLDVNRLLNSDPDL